MADAIARACDKWLCGHTQPCPTHGRQKRTEAQSDHDKARHRLYHTARWQAFRALILRQRPLCELCLAQGKTEAAQDVHHVIALRDGGAPFDSANVQALSRACHSRETRAGR